MRVSALAAAAFLALPNPIAAQSAAPAPIFGDLPAEDLARVRNPEVLAAQVLLDRARFSPGVIDGAAGGNVARAIGEFSRAHGLPAGQKLDRALLEKLRETAPGPVLMRHTLTETDLARPYVDRVPADFVEQAKLEHVGFTNAVEAVAERFHMSEGLLQALNPGATFTAGDTILVAAVRTDAMPGEIKRIEVDKSASAVRAFGADDRLLASYPATIGSAAMPSPAGTMQVEAVATEAAYYFDPGKLNFGPKEKLTIAAGPNNPVGGIWIDLSEDGYGIHGAPDPKLIRKTSSHGCVRLTNWDARELAKAVKAGVEVAFIG